MNITRRLRHPLAGLLGLSLAGATSAADISTSGFAASELRWFPQSPLFSGQLTGAEPSLLLAPEFRFRSEDGKTRGTFAPFVRLTGRNNDRSHLDIREAYVATRKEDWDFLIGINKVFWGVAESRHLVNIVNQTDIAEDTDEEDKLGQPMIAVGLQKDWGRLDTFVLPGFRERDFPDLKGRLRSPEPADENGRVIESSLGNAHVDVAARYSHVLGDWDLGLSIFRGISREARLPLSPDGTRRVPHYDLITQGGLDLQYTREEWLWKFEGILREGHGSTFAAMVGGFEYTHFQIFQTNADLGLLAEYHRDGRDPASTPSTGFDNDVFLGARYALNDVDDTQALAGTVIDLGDGTMSFFVEAERRIGDSWKIEAELRILTNVDAANELAAFRRDSFANLRLSRHF
jgi:hypothetical protein